tara:strand:- start:242 stop:508 length:267 start_codon:yes stop_codon:yes gene_type:complete
MTKQWDEPTSIHKTITLSARDQLHLAELIASCTRVLVLCTDKIDEKNYGDFSAIIKEAGKSHNAAASLGVVMKTIHNNLGDSNVRTNK